MGDLANVDEAVAALYASCGGTTGDPLTVADLKQSLRSATVNMLSDAQLDNLVAMLDSDGDGIVAWDDFQTVMRAYVSGRMSPSHTAAAETPVPRSPDGIRGSPDGVNGSLDHDPDCSFEGPEVDKLGDLYRRACDQLRSRFNVPSDVMESVVSLSERLAEARSASKDERFLALAQHCDQITKKAEHLREVNAHLSDECQRVEAELEQMDALRRKLEETVAEMTRLQEETTLAKAQLAKATESEREARLTADTIEGRMQAMLQAATEKADKLAAELEQRRTDEVERDELLWTVKKLTKERDTLLREYNGLSTELEHHGLRVKGQDEASMQLQLENTMLTEHLNELKASLKIKDESISELEAKVEEQNTTMNRLRQRAEGAPLGCKGSIMNELEDIVMSQLRGAGGDHGSSSDLLQKLLPSADDASHRGRMTSNSSFTSNVFSPATNGRAKPRGPSSSSVTAALTSPAPAGTVTAPPPPHSHFSRDKETPLPSSSPAAQTPATPSTGAVTPAAGAEAGINTTADASVMSILNATGVNATLEEAPSSLDLVYHGTASKDVISSLGARASEPLVVTQDKLDAALRLYAASTQHLAGMKIITRERAELMDCEELMRIKDTLNDLITARSQRLTEALEERDRTNNEIEVKNRVVIPVMQLFCADVAESTASSALQTPAASGSRGSFFAAERASSSSFSIAAGSGSTAPAATAAATAGPSTSAGAAQTATPQAQPSTGLLGKVGRLFSPRTSVAS
eukprot:m.162978 g.162978  ORF g.162978 m.162978 type:complete len:749 (+) comp17103_c0_seq3:257-2503(+)